MGKVINVIEQIDAIATKHPDWIAYDYLGEKNTYGELKAYSDSLASYILTRGIKEESPIMVYGAQTFKMIATFLGIVKSGHAYVPIDRHSPAERLTMINEIAEPGLCIAVEDLPISLKDLPILEGQELVDVFESNKSVTPNSFVTGDDNYYIIFTSGTTGKPKGVQISHNNLLSFVNWEVNDFDLPEQPATLSQPPYSFDLSVMDLYPTLVLGGTLKAIPKQVTDDFKKLFEVLPTLGLNVWVSTPSFMDICLLQPTFDAEHFPALTRFLFCGEELTHATAQALKQRFPNAKIFNTYGPTEATVAVTSIEITDEVLEKYDRLPIGHLKDDTVGFILDDNEDIANAGTEGELVLAGPSVSKGYLNNQEKTDEAFFEYDGQQAYKTGDLTVMDEDGMLYYRGRTDFQIKLHGYRIELEEVNHYLNNDPLIQSGVAVPKYGKDNKVAQLVAYVVPEKNDFDSQIKLTVAIKDSLKDNMMEYMVPNRFIFVDSLPQTANGKIDIKTVIAEVNA
ncbi:D-alanine--poly(phosphoribitol) ligase subunit DltA [Pediococcus stilesii]|uniref:D-alanine--D-alanyl carrier protein ligase n=1 Tax=Pediococcus stilesii TaxID=331679 RepID=A0A5R9BWW7_9LACO|nr:D-alanine--poly(phosphoribitol) ligase subunit DltA [Pediococcus stilesii]TLQ04783.1 D-alanine--poly(phosphoribitol) ligase subunit DltA [Pediococcus stilesii]